MNPSRIPLLLALVAAGCHTTPKPADQENFAIALVEAARSPEGIRADQVDADLVERVRRTQLVRRMTLDTYDREKLLTALAGETGPDRQYPPADRAQKQRERATRGLKANAQGTCTATVDAEQTAIRVKFLTEPIASVPAEVLAARGELASALRTAEVVRLTCTSGKLGVLLVRAPDGKPRVVDLYEIGRGSVEFDPNDPAMK